MRAGRHLQPLSYPLRLPDAVQGVALRLLDASRQVINATVAALWERLDDFGERETRYAYKQVTALIGSPEPHGDRQWRCEAEQTGRILRAQAARKKQFALLLPLLSEGMIRPQREKQPAGKNRKAIKAVLACLREENSDGGSTVELQNLIEQACNFYLTHGCFPDTYEEMQPIPVLKVGILPYAGDDGGEQGQAYRLRLDLEGRCCYFAFRAPDQIGQWSPRWTEPQTRLPLPDPLLEHLRGGESLAPTLREIASCWRKYEARNNDLAHLAANILILLASVWEAELISGESLKSLKSEGRGRGAKGRWVNWRNNSQIRGALWRTLRYKCRLSGLHLVWQYPTGTTHTCPHCGQPAHTYTSPALDATKLDAGPWLRCVACGWNGARDYAAAINIALLGVVFLKQAPSTTQDNPSPLSPHPTMKEKGLNSDSYSGSGLALRLPPTSLRGRLLCSGKRYVNGWIKSVTLHSALAKEIMLRLCG